MTRLRALCLMLFWTLEAGVAWAQIPGPITWPTSNGAFMQGQGNETFIQPTVSGRVESGLYGCVRNDGDRFHEGIDLFPVFRTPSGEADEPVYAIMRGRVVYVNAVAGRSGYGRYVVLEHPDADVAVYTLYSHLASVGEGIVPGVEVAAGDSLGKMGRSASYTIPKSRAHLHFEIGLRLGDGFQGWYDEQDNQSPNYFGVWNGMNLSGFDPLAFFTAVRAGSFSTFTEHIQAHPDLATLRIHTSRVPDFAHRYPTLVTRPLAGRSDIAAWDISYSQHGVPKKLTPWFAGELNSKAAGSVELISIDEALRFDAPCWKSFSREGNTYELASFLRRSLALMFEY